MKCHICDELLTGTANKNLYMCKVPRSIYFEEFKDSFVYYDFAIEFDENGLYKFLTYQIFPYQIFIRKKDAYPTYYGTFVQIFNGIIKDNINIVSPIIGRWMPVFHTNEIIDFPVKETEKCLEKIKKLILFS